MLSPSAPIAGEVKFNDMIAFLGLFCIGYYHQRQKFFEKKDKSGPASSSETESETNS